MCGKEGVNGGWIVTIKERIIPRDETRKGPKGIFRFFEKLEQIGVTDGVTPISELGSPFHSGILAVFYHHPSSALR